MTFWVFLLQIMHAVGIAGTKLGFDRSEALPAHETYFALAEACMATDPAQRPSFTAMQLVSGQLVVDCAVVAALRRAVIRTEREAQSVDTYRTAFSLRRHSNRHESAGMAACHLRCAGFTMWGRLF